eukprot:ANDGO_00679.mRNA.1 hypothetical protein GUITHDRAFT_146773
MNYDNNVGNPPTSLWFTVPALLETGFRSVNIPVFHDADSDSISIAVLSAPVVESVFPSSLWVHDIAYVVTVVGSSFTIEYVTCAAHVSGDVFPGILQFVDSSTVLCSIHPTFPARSFRLAFYHQQHLITLSSPPVLSALPDPVLGSVSPFQTLANGGEFIGLSFREQFLYSDPIFVVLDEKIVIALTSQLTFISPSLYISDSAGLLKKVIAKPVPSSSVVSVDPLYILYRALVNVSRVDSILLTGTSVFVYSGFPSSLSVVPTPDVQALVLSWNDQRFVCRVGVTVFLLDRQPLDGSFVECGNVVTEAGFHAVEISYDSMSTFTSDGVSIESKEPPIVNYLLPSRVLVSGGTVLTVVGSMLSAGPDHTAVLKALVAPEGSSAVSVCTYVSSSLLLAESPPLPQSAQDLYDNPIVVLLSTNMVDYVQCIPSLELFSMSDFVFAPFVTHPSFIGTPSNGETTLFVPLFGNSESLEVSGSCRFSSGLQSFYLASQPMLYSVMNSVVLGKSEAVVTVIGSNFMIADQPQRSCHWFSEALNHFPPTSSLFVSSSSVLCRFPASDRGHEVPYVVSLSICIQDGVCTSMHNNATLLVFRSDVTPQIAKPSQLLLDSGGSSVYIVFPSFLRNTLRCVFGGKTRTVLETPKSRIGDGSIETSFCLAPRLKHIDFLTILALPPFLDSVIDMFPAFNSSAVTAADASGVLHDLNLFPFASIFGRFSFFCDIDSVLVSAFWHVSHSVVYCDVSTISPSFAAPLKLVHDSNVFTLAVFRSSIVEARVESTFPDFVFVETLSKLNGQFFYVRGRDLHVISAVCALSSPSSFISAWATGSVQFLSSALVVCGDWGLVPFSVVEHPIGTSAVLLRTISADARRTTSSLALLQLLDSPPQISLVPDFSEWTGGSRIVLSSTFLDAWIVFGATWISIRGFSPVISTSLMLPDASPQGTSISLRLSPFSDIPQAPFTVMKPLNFSSTNQPSYLSSQFSGTLDLHLTTSFSVGSLFFSDLRCVFGSTGFSSTLMIGPSLSADLLVNIINCLPPSDHRIVHGFVPVFLSQNHNLRFASDPVDIHFHALFHVQSVFPAAVSSTSPTTLIVTGDHFLDLSNSLFCSLPSVTFSVAFTSSRMVRCLFVPTAVACSSSSRCLIEISLGGRDSSANSTELYIIPEVPAGAASVFPSTYLSRTRSVLQLRSNALFKPVYSLACRFGQKTFVRISYINSSFALCGVPGRASLTANVDFVRMQITQAPFHFSDVSVSFSAYSSSAERSLYPPSHLRIRDGVQILALVPSSGSTAGGTVVFVQGSGFSGIHTRVLCRFGTLFSSRPAKILSDTMLVCVSPPVFAQAHMQHDTNEYMRIDSRQLWSTRHVVLSLVSSEGVPLVNSTRISGRNFHYFPCPPGMYCISELALPVPIGTFSNSASRSNFSLCVPGTYQDILGQLDCFPCPVGRICPFSGMRTPLLCPAGRVCNVTGLVISRGLCPPGHYCPLGTISYSPNTTIPNRPIPCGAGVYCSEGTRQEQPSIDGDFGTSQPCFGGFVCLPTASDPRGSYACPPGFYCAPEVQIDGRLATLPKPCPPGSFCNGTANVNATQCKPGTYADGYGSILCKQCPFGFLCQGFGTRKPDLCPAGFVCVTRGLSAPMDLCPAGFYCGRGIATDTPLGDGFPDDGIRRPKKCDAGTYCLAGVKSKEVRVAQIGYPQHCLAGTYCLEGTPTMVGIECTPGFYCPPASSQPVSTIPGFIAPGYRSVRPIPCQPGTYAPNSSMYDCISCPVGRTCPFQATAVPVVCPPGTFRNLSDGISCVSCPAGTWSEVEGLSGVSLCKECPEGRVCPMPGLAKLSSSNPCPEGFTCGSRVTLSLQRNNPCPATHSCSIQTYADSSESFTCPAGYVCPPGTSFSGRRRVPCVPGYYCPPGLTKAENDEYRCPRGTTSRMAARVYSDCQKDFEWLLSHGGYVDSINPIVLDSATKAKAEVFGFSFVEAQVLRSASSGGVRSAGAQSTSFSIIKFPTLGYMRLTFSLGNLTDFVLNDDYRISIFAGETEADILPSDADGDGELDTFPERLADDEYLLAAGQEFDASFPFVVYYFAQRPMYLRVSIELMYGVLSGFKDSFLGVSTASFIAPSRGVLGSTASFFAILPRFDDISLLLNPPPAEDALGQTGIVPISKAHQQVLIRNEDDLRVQPDDFWVERQPALLVPYLPYASRCDTFDSLAPFSALFESEEYCSLVPAGQTVPVNEFNPFGGSPYGDSCSYSISCYYEENIAGTAQAPRWYEIEAQSDPLFYITTDPIDAATTSSGGGSYVSQLLGTQFIPVLVEGPPGVVGGTPSSVTFEVGYYQMAPNVKRIVLAQYVYSFSSAPESYVFGNASSETISIGNVTEGGSSSTSSQPQVILPFTISFRSLTYFELLNLFAFSLPLYLVLYFVIAFFAILVTFSFWIVHRVFTKLKHPPGLRFFACVSLMAPPPFIGSFLVLAPSFAVLAIAWSILNAGVFDSVPADWNAAAAADEETLLKYRAGRFGLCNLVVGVFMCLKGVNLFVLDRGDNNPRLLKPDDEELWYPLFWKRSHMLFIGFINVLFLVVLLEFSYSKTFAENIYVFVIVLKVVGMLHEKLMMDVLYEALFVVPYGIALLLTQFTMTLGASTFTDFVIGFFIDLILAILQRLYFDPALGKFLAQIPGYIGLIKRFFKNLLKRMKRKSQSTRQANNNSMLSNADADGDGATDDSSSARLSDDDDEDVEDAFNLKEELHLISAMVESMVVYSIDDCALIFSPIFITYLFVFRKETLISELYGIRDQDFVFYVVFTLVIMFAQMVMDVFLDNIMELFYGWKTFEYIKFTRDRYNRRQTDWRGMDDQMNEALPAEIRSIDHLCFSPQYFFQCGLFAAGLIYTVFSVEIMFRQEYVMFDDPLFAILVPLLLVSCGGVASVLMWLREKLGIWKVRSDIDALERLRTGSEGADAEEAAYRRQLGSEFEATRWAVDDALLMAPTGADGSLSERMMNDETREEFLRVNRPWIVERIAMFLADQESLDASPTDVALSVVDMLSKETDFQSLSKLTDFPAAPKAPSQADFSLSEPVLLQPPSTKTAAAATGTKGRLSMADRASAAASTPIPTPILATLDDDDGDGDDVLEETDGAAVLAAQNLSAATLALAQDA